MCDYLSFVLTDDEKVLRGLNLDSHSGISYLHNLTPGTYRECEWIEDDYGDSLSVRLSPDDEYDENWYKSIILAKYTNRKALEKYLIPTLNGKYSGGNTVYWFKRGKLHRLDGPAKIDNNGAKEWYKNGKRHRDNGPACVLGDIKEWWKNGKLHRIDGPAKIRKQFKEWWVNGELHREDGPAIECPDRTKRWYKNGKLHRIDGPAVIYPDGTQEWYKNGKRYYP